MFLGTFTPGSPVNVMVILLMGRRWAGASGCGTTQGQVSVPVGKPHRAVCHLDDSWRSAG